MEIIHYAIIQHFKRQREMGRTGRARRNGRENVRDGVSKASRAGDGAGGLAGGLAGRAEEQAGRVSKVWAEVSGT